jgi:hypothetical protein
MFIYILLDRTSDKITNAYFSPIMTFDSSYNELISIYALRRIYEYKCVMYECVCNGE